MSGPVVAQKNQVTQPHSTDGSKLWVRPAQVGIFAAVGTAAIAAVDPTDSGFVVCLSKRFGFDCPLCGGLRTVTSLAHGDFTAALDHNLILAVSLPVLAVIWVVWMMSALRGSEFRLPTAPKWLVASAALLILAFTVTRNLDAPAWAAYLTSGVYRN